jgi:hypothetical protein
VPYGAREIIWVSSEFCPKNQNKNKNKKVNRKMRLGKGVLFFVYGGLILSAVIGTTVIGFGYGYNSYVNSQYVAYNCTVVGAEVAYQYYQRGYRCYYATVTFRIDKKGDYLLTVDPHVLLCSGREETKNYILQNFYINSIHTCYVGPNNSLTLSLINTTASLITGIIFIILFLILLFCFLLSCFL